MEPTTKSFLNIFSKVKDPRMETENKKHLLIDIIAICVSAVICKYETWEEIADYGEEKYEWLKTFLDLPNGPPSHDTLRRVFMLLDPREFNRCFLEWAEFLRERIEK